MGPEMQPETTMRLDRARVRELMALVVATRDVALPDDDAVALRDIGFRSLDFSELALRVEDEIDRELNFDAPGLRSVVTVGDVLDLIDQLQAGS
jgi:acyl carrier protein